MRRTVPMMPYGRRPSMLTLTAAGGLLLLVTLPWAVELFGWLPDPFDIDFEPLEGASRAHWLGTTDAGTDVLAELAAGLRASSAFALVTAVFGVLLAFGAGLAGAMLPGSLRSLWARATDVVTAVPPILPLIALGAVLMPPAWANALLLASLLWAPSAKLIYATALAEAGSGWFAASKRFGAGPWYLMRRHLLPAVAPLVPVVGLSIFRRAVFTEAALGFLGLADPTVRTLGGMMSQALQYYYLPEVWLRWLLPPVVALSLMMGLAMMLVTASGERATFGGRCDTRSKGLSKGEPGEPGTFNEG